MNIFKRIKYINELRKNNKLNEKIELLNVKITTLEKTNDDLYIELAICEEQRDTYKNRLDSIKSFINDEHIYFGDGESWTNVCKIKELAEGIEKEEI